MQSAGITRYVVTTGLNVDAPGDQKSGPVKAATEWMYANYPETTRDKQLEYECLSASDADWTLVRLPLIDLTDDVRPVEVSLTDCPGQKISARSLAEFLVGQLQDQTYVRKAPFIADR